MLRTSTYFTDVMVHAQVLLTPPFQIISVFVNQLIGIPEEKNTLILNDFFELLEDRGLINNFFKAALDREIMETSLIFFSLTFLILFPSFHTFSIEYKIHIILYFTNLFVNIHNIDFLLILAIFFFFFFF